MLEEFQGGPQAGPHDANRRQNLFKVLKRIISDAEKLYSIIYYVWKNYIFYTLEKIAGGNENIPQRAGRQKRGLLAVLRISF